LTPSSWWFLQGVLVDLAILDNHAQVLKLDDNLDVLQWIAIDIDLAYRLIRPIFG
jgi:hypothetical protein